MRRLPIGFALFSSLFLVGCGHPARKAGDCDGPCPASKINHVVIVIQENHTFDTYFGRYCTATTGSAPTCNDGPACCEAGPMKEPSGADPVVLDDAANANWDPDHHEDCEIAETDNGLMDKYVTGTDCSDPNNFAYADPTVIAPYHMLASQNAMADRYFQATAGQSSSNDMYLFTANFVFKDNTARPDALGASCGIGGMASTFTGKTIGDLLDGAKVSWTWYAQGYDVMAKAQSQGMSCPDSDAMCPSQLPIYPCIYDGGDYPVQYYAQFRDKDQYIRDYTNFAKDLKDSNLPQVAYVRGLGFRSEHPGLGDKISDGETFVNEVVSAVQGSVYAADTVVLVAWDEGGGYFDHVSPPGNGSDGQPYGTRIPFLAIGPMVKKNFVSHVQMEHSSVVKFLEWNWLKGQTGQLGARDANVNNLGDLFDPTTAGTIPAN